MPRPQQHLAEVVEIHGTGDATGAVVALVEEALHARRAKRDAARGAEGKTQKTYPYVTDAGKECDRSVALSFTDAPRDELTVDSLINFGIGEAVEEWFIESVRELGLEVLEQVRVALPAVGTIVSGKADALVLPDGVRTDGLMELKSTSSRSMSAMLKAGERGQYGHRKQLNLYLHASHLGVTSPQIPVFDYGYLVYIVKDATKREPPIHSFLVPYDRVEAEDDIARLSRIRIKANDGTLPGVPDGYSWGKFPCGWCDYRTFCWDGGAK